VQQALTLLSAPEIFLKSDTHLRGQKVLIAAPSVLAPHINEALERFGGLQPTLYLFDTASLDKTYDQAAKELTALGKTADRCLFLSWNGHLYPLQMELAKELSGRLRPEQLVVAGLRNPQEIIASGLWKRHIALLTYCPFAPSIYSVLAHLESHTLPTGRLPLKRIDQ
jgi:hypothetical protein